MTVIQAFLRPWTLPCVWMIPTFLSKRRRVGNRAILRNPNLLHYFLPQFTGIFVTTPRCRSRHLDHLSASTMLPTVDTSVIDRPMIVGVRLHIHTMFSEQTVVVQNRRSIRVMHPSTALPVIPRCLVSNGQGLVIKC